MEGLQVHLPGPLDIAVPALALVLLVGLVVLTIVNIVRAEDRPGRKAVWIVAVVLLPVVGVLAWFAFGRRSTTSRSRAATA